MKLHRKKIAGILFFSTLIFFDQFLKYIIRSQSGFYICNQGIAFGVDTPKIILYILWIGIILFLIQALYKKYYPFLILFILAGAISNFIDRILFGCVTDFISLPLWPAFNFADIYITLGFIILAIKILTKK
jgi:signal peptidase II